MCWRICSKLSTPLASGLETRYHCCRLRACCPVATWANDKKCTDQTTGHWRLRFSGITAVADPDRGYRQPRFAAFVWGVSTATAHPRSLTQSFGPIAKMSRRPLSISTANIDRSFKSAYRLVQMPKERYGSTVRAGSPPPLFGSPRDTRSMSLPRRGWQLSLVRLELESSRHRPAS